MSKDSGSQDGNCCCALAFPSFKRTDTSPCVREEVCGCGVCTTELEAGRPQVCSL